MSLLIQNGRIVTATDDFVGDVLVEGETIAALGPHVAAPAGAELVDAAGKLVFPGFIDPHVHIYLPFMGTYAKDDYASASRAALVGGTTTLIEMCCPARNDDPLAAFELWLSKGAISACDYTFHMGVSRFDATTAGAIREIAARGIASLKVFLAYKGAFGINDGELFATLRLAKELGLIVTAHCENETLVDELQRRLLSEGKTGPEWHEPSRPPRVEAEGVHHLMTFAELTGAHVYCVHTSCREALESVQAARLRGVRAWVETVIPYLVLDKSYAERPDFEGAKYVMSPPLREKSHRPALWNALRSRLISTVATDHAPFDYAGQKEMGRGDFTKIPNGIPSVEDRVNLLYTHGVAKGRIDLATFVDAASTQAARLFGLYPRKGTIAVGSDADLVVYDPAYRGKISARTQQMAADYSAFEDWEIEGRPSLVTVRGQAQVREGRFVGQLGSGKFLPPARPRTSNGRLLMHHTSFTSRQFRDAFVATALVAAVGALAAAAAVQGLATWLEAASFVTGALCVWLTVKENIWNFPLGLANVATFCVVFFRAGLFADAGLQIVYFVLGVIGWYMWLYGGARRTRLEASRASSLELASLLIFAAAGTLVLWQLLHQWGGSASFWDALTTSLSLCSQWLLNRKKLESWLGWILVDAIYIPLYAWKELYLTALLYGVFLIMAVLGWRSWQSALNRRDWKPPDPTVAGVAVP